MKTAILTFQFAENYGALLQAYALKEYLVKKGAEVSFIDYTPDKEKVFYSLNPLSAGNPKAIIKKSLQIKDRSKIHKLFQNFQRDYLNVPSGVKYNPKDLTERFDCIIVGSDQVWNRHIVEDMSPYLLKGMDGNCVKASYAASMSILEPQVMIENGMITELQKFDFISVREESAGEFLQENGINAVTVVDPVYLLPGTEWSKLAKRPKAISPDKNYVLLYMLRDDIEYVKNAEKYAADRGLELYYFHPLNRKLNASYAKLIRDVDPFEFVWLIEHAEAIFTNSFHATAFSSIFGKCIRYLHKDGLGNRVFDLLKTVNASEKDDGCTEVSVNDCAAFQDRMNISIEYLDSIRARAERKDLG